jgi:large subunit ribosomal protein L5
MAKQQGPTQPQQKKTGKEQKAEKMFETADVAIQFVPRLRQHYEQVVRPELQRQFGYKNPMQIPKLEKIVINMGVGRGEQEPKTLENAMRDLALISGQKPVATVAQTRYLQLPDSEGTPHRL